MASRIIIRQTPLAEAVETHHAQLVEFLLTQNIAKQDTNKMIPRAAHRGDEKVMKALIPPCK